MKISYLLFTTLFSILLWGCHMEREQVEGTWMIEDVSVNGYNIQPQLKTNQFIYNIDGTCKLPLLEWIGAADGHWEYTKDDEHTYLVITSPDNIFGNRYILMLIKDNHQKIVGMQLQSGNTHIQCRKLENGIPVK